MTDLYGLKHMLTKYLSLNALSLNKIVNLVIDFLKVKTNNRKIIQYLLLFFSLLAFVYSIYHSYKRVNMTYYTQEVTKASILPVFTDEQIVKQKLNYTSGGIGKIYLFANNIESCLGERLNLSLKQEGKTVISKDIIIEQNLTVIMDSIVINFESLNLKENTIITLELSMPEIKSGLALRSNDAFLGNDLELIVNDDVLDDKVLTIQVLPDKQHFPRWTYGAMALCFIIFLYSTPNIKYSTLALSLTIFAIVLTISVFCWEMRLGTFWGHYWPDGYTRIAYKIKDFFYGHLNFSELKTFLTNNNNGQSWFVPFMIALFSIIGLNFIHAFILLNILFTTSAIALFYYLSTKNKAFKTKRDKLILLIFLSINVLTFRAFASPLTDAGGLFFAALFSVSFALLIKKDSNTKYLIFFASLAIVLGCQTRIALFSMICVPPSMVVWSYIFKKERNVKQLIIILLPFIIGLTILVLCFSVMELWTSIKLARAFAAHPTFKVDHYFYKFSKQSLIAMQLFPILLIMNTKRLFKIECDALFVCLIFGFQAMLYTGHIVPWLRYWIPVSILANFYSVSILTNCNKRKWLVYILFFIIACCNLHYALKYPLHL